ncbi:MAG: hypothetical protein ACKVHP_12045, partial [Verrucomicrobiales bacterium]
SLAFNRGSLEMIDAERAPLIPLFILQGVILFLLGTGQVAGAMTAEGDEGVLDYQRLAPMTPLAKVLGYLFGLPIREYLLCTATFPFTFWCLWKGGVPLQVAFELYATFFCSAILYHLTGLIAGTVVKNRRWAFLVSIGIVFLLYTIIPQLAKFGLVYFRYLTVRPVFEEHLAALLPQTAGAVVATFQRLIPQARFFNLNLPETIFTLSSQAMLILTGIVMLWRRWRRDESHLLGKAWAVGLYAWTQVMLLGNALPLIDTGSVFPSREMNRRFRNFQSQDWQPEGVEAVVMSGAFGLVSLISLWVMTLLITPSSDTQIRGWRRMRKLGRRSMPPTSDPATGFWAVVLMALLGTTGWFIFSAAVVESHWFAQPMPMISGLAFGLTLIIGGVGFHALLEGRGGKVATLTAILLGVVPIMLGTVIGSMNDRFIAIATWFYGMSPVTGPFFGPGATLPMADLPIELFKAVPRAFWFFQCIMLLATFWFVIGLWQGRAAIAKSTI